MSEQVDGIVYDIEIGGDFDVPLDRYHDKVKKNIDVTKKYIDQLKLINSTQKGLKQATKAELDAAKAKVASAKAAEAATKAETAQIRKQSEEQKKNTLELRKKNQELRNAEQKVKVETQQVRLQLAEQRKIISAARERDRIERAILKAKKDQAREVAKEAAKNPEYIKQLNIQRAISNEKRAQERLGSFDVQKEAAKTRALREQRKELNKLGLTSVATDSRLGKLLARMRQLRGEGNNLLFTFRRLVGVMAAFTIARKVVQLFNQLIHSAVEYNSVLEQATLGVSALFVAAGSLYTSDGGFSQEIAGQAQAIETASAEARRQLQSLRIESLTTAATFEQLATAFQTAVGPGLAAGFDPDQIRKFSVRISQAAAAIGLPQQQLAEEIRSILTGAITTRTTRIATVLGITNKDISKWKEMGTLWENLEKRFSPFEAAGEKALNTFKAAITNARDSIEALLGIGTEGFFEDLKDAFTSVRLAILDIRGEDAFSINEDALRVAQALGSGLQLALQSLVQITEKVDWSNLLAAVNAFSFGIKVAAAAATGVVDAFVDMAAFVGVFTNMFGETEDWQEISSRISTIVKWTVIWMSTLSIIKGLQVGIIAIQIAMSKVVRATTKLFFLQKAYHKALLMYNVALLAGSTKLAAVWKAIATFVSVPIVVALAKITLVVGVISAIVFGLLKYWKRIGTYLGGKLLGIFQSVGHIWEDIVIGMKQIFSDMVTGMVRKTLEFARKYIQTWNKLTGIGEKALKKIDEMQEALNENQAKRDEELQRQREAKNKRQIQETKALTQTIEDEMESAAKADEDRIGKVGEFIDGLLTGAKKKAGELSGGLFGDLAIGGPSEAIKKAGELSEELDKTNKSLTAEYEKQVGLLGKLGVAAEIYSLEFEKNVKIQKETEGLVREILTAENLLALARKEGSRAEELKTLDTLRNLNTARLELERQISEEYRIRARQQSANAIQLGFEQAEDSRLEALQADVELNFVIDSRGLTEQELSIAEIAEQRRQEVAEKTRDIYEATNTINLSLLKSVRERTALEEELASLTAEAGELEKVALDDGKEQNAAAQKLLDIRARMSVVAAGIENILTHEAALNDQIKNAEGARSQIVEFVENKYKSLLKIREDEIRVARTLKDNEEELTILKERQSNAATRASLVQSSFRASTFVREEIQRAAVVAELAKLKQEEGLLNEQVAKAQASGDARIVESTNEKIEALKREIAFKEENLQLELEALGARSGGALDFTDQSAIIDNTLANLRKLEKNAGSAAQNIADAFSAPFEGLRSGLVDGLNEYIYETGEAGDVIKGLWTGVRNSILNTMIEGFANIITQMILQQVIGENAMNVLTAAGAATRTGIRASEHSTALAMDAAGAASHAGAEGAKTTATTAGAATRGGLRLGEFLADMGQQAVSLASFVAGQLARTATVAAQVATRLPFLMTEAAATIWGSVSAIPIVGPFLAPAVIAGMVAMIASGFAEGGLAQGFATGGAVLSAIKERGSQGFAVGGSPTSSSSARRRRKNAGKRPAHIDNRDTIPAWLRVGEFVVRPEAVRHYGSSFLDAINTMRFNPMSVSAFSGISQTASMRQSGDSGKANMAREVVRLNEQGFAQGGQAGPAVAGSLGMDESGSSVVNSGGNSSDNSNNINVAMLNVTEGMSEKGMRDFFVKATKDKKVGKAIVQALLNNKIMWEK